MAAVVSIALLVLAQTSSKASVGPKLESAFVEALTRSHNASRISRVLTEISELQKISLQKEEISRSAELISLLTDRSEVQSVLTRLKIIEPPDNLGNAFKAIPSDAPQVTEFETRLKAKWRAHAGVFEEPRSTSMQDVVVVTTGSYGHRVYFRNWNCVAKRYGLKYLLLAADHIIHALAGKHSILLPNARSKEDLEDVTPVKQRFLNRMACHRLLAVSTLVNDGASVAYVEHNTFFKADPMYFLKAVMDYDFIYGPRSEGCTSDKQRPPGSCLAPSSTFYFVNAKKPAVRHMWRIAHRNCLNSERDGAGVGATEGGGAQASMQRTLNDVLGLDTHWNKKMFTRRHNHMKVPKEWSTTMTDLPASSPFLAARWCSEKVLTSSNTFSYCVLDPIKYPGQRHSILSLDGNQVIAASVNLKMGHAKYQRLKLMKAGVWLWDVTDATGPDGRCMTRWNATAKGLSSISRSSRSRRSDSYSRSGESSKSSRSSSSSGRFIGSSSRSRKSSRSD